MGRFTALVFQPGTATWEIDIAGALGPIAVTSVVIRWRQGQAPRQLEVLTTMGGASSFRRVGKALAGPFGDETRVLLSGREITRLKLQMVRVCVCVCVCVAWRGFGCCGVACVCVNTRVVAWHYRPTRQRSGCGVDARLRRRVPWCPSHNRVCVCACCPLPIVVGMPRVFPSSFRSPLLPP